MGVKLSPQSNLSTHQRPLAGHAGRQPKRLGRMEVACFIKVFAERGALEGDALFFDGEIALYAWCEYQSQGEYLSVGNRTPLGHGYQSESYRRVHVDDWWQIDGFELVIRGVERQAGACARDNGQRGKSQLSKPTAL